MANLLPHKPAVQTVCVIISEELLKTFCTVGSVPDLSRPLWRSGYCVVLKLFASRYGSSTVIVKGIVHPKINLLTLMS